MRIAIVILVSRLRSLLKWRLHCAAIDGVGLAFVSDERVLPHLGSGALIRVLENWRQPFPGFFPYYPSRRQQPAPITALINAFAISDPSDREQ